MIAGWVALSLALAMTQPSDARDMMFSDLSGWAEDDHQAALAAFLVTCDLYADAGLCRAGADAAAKGGARAFFETWFQPVRLSERVLFTGYHEPEFEGSLHRGGRFMHPVHARVPDHAGNPGPSRRELRERGLLAGAEIAWLADPLDAFLMQVQGSGRVRLAEGGVLRLGYAGRNGQPYVSIGKLLIEEGEVSAEAMSVPTIRAWAARNAGRVMGLLDRNPSYVFFRRLEIAEEEGPPGAMDRPVTAGRTLAVDRARMPLGSPVWTEIADGVAPMRRLMVAQDTGSAITGAGRADIFHGSGGDAADIAGRQKDFGQMILLVPRDGRVVAQDGTGAPQQDAPVSPSLTGSQ